MQTPIFIGSEIYRGSSYGSRHPLAIPRVSTVMDLVRAMGWLSSLEYRTSPRALPSVLTGFHTSRYIAALQAAEEIGSVTEDIRQRHQLGTISNPIFPEMYRRPATAAGGSLLAAALLADGGTVFNPAGGTHHGMPDHASGFCYLNDPVLAIMSLQAQGLQRIAYVDIDAHHCDGVEAAFAGAESIRVISTHEEGRWPFTGALGDHASGAAFNFPLPRDANDTEFNLVLDQVILPAVAAHRPEAIVLQCGADAVEEDPLARLAFSNNAHWATVSNLRHMSPRFLVLGGGGYNPWSVGRLWAGVWAILADAEIPERLPEEAEAILRQLDWRRDTKKERPEHWFTTLRDTPRDGPIRDTVRNRARTLQQRLVTWA